MPQSDMKLASVGSTTLRGVFIGSHVHAGGLWSGDYIVADYEPFKKDCDVATSKVSIQLEWKVRFPVAERFRERALKDKDFSAPSEMPELGETSADEGERSPADTAEADEPSAKAETLFAGADIRGEGLEAFDGRGPTGSARVRKGSAMPPNIGA